jgi:two-component system LytT family response regulator
MNTDRKAINVIIVDDEKKACTNLVNILKEFVDADVNIAGIANSTAEAEECIRRSNPDALFLDIEMPNENAFQFLERIAPFNFEVIFVTAFDEYALRAFRLNALDYILKPISISELKASVQKLRDKMLYRTVIEDRSISYLELSEQVANKTKLQTISLKDGSSTEVVNFKDILFIEALSSYSRILFTKNGVVREMTMSSPMGDYEELLPTEYFFRIHRTYLVNVMHLKKIVNENSNHVIVHDHYALPVGRRRYISLIEFLKNNEYHNGAA